LKEPTRLYLKSVLDQFYLKCAWFHNNKINEMLIGFYGLNSNEASLKFVYPEKVFSNEELRTLTFTYPDFIEADEKVDHITVHADGTFHIKVKNPSQLYRDTMKRTVPLGANTSVFLEMMIITDLTKKYKKIANPLKYPHIWIDSNENEFFIIECVFSGAHYSLEPFILSRLTTTKRYNVPCLHLNSSTIRGYICPVKKRIPLELLKNRPDGTIILFKFPTMDNRYRIKGFIFA
jgi:hypothetical protein